MNAVSLYIQKNDNYEPANTWMCEKCNLIHHDQDVANKCCTCIYCGNYVDQTGYRKTYHEECRNISDKKDENEKLAKSEKLINWNGWVYLDLGTISTHDGYFENINSLTEYLNYLLKDGRINLTDWPEFAWIADPSPVAIPDMDDIISQICDNGYDGIEDDIDGLPEFEAALTDFASRNKELFVYWPNDKKAVAIPKPQQEN